MALSSNKGGKVTVTMLSTIDNETTSSSDLGLAKELSLPDRRQLRRSSILTLNPKAGTISSH